MCGTSNRENGATLLELLIGVALSLLVILGLYHFFSSQRVHGQWINTLTSMQEQGFAAGALLRNAIQMAGYAGCVSWQTRYATTLEPIQLESRETENLSLQPQSDILSIEYWQAIPHTVILRINPYKLELKSNVHFDTSHHYILHDCQHMQAITIDKIKHRKGVVTLVLNHPIPTDWQQPQLAEHVCERWMIAKTQWHNATAKPVSALYQQINNHPWQEVVSDVYTLQIKLGKPIRVAYVIGSEQESLSAIKPIPVNDTFFQPEDKRFYQAWQLSIDRLNG